MLLPSVVRWNGAVAGDRYAELLGLTGTVGSDASAADLLARKLEDLSAAGGLSNKLSDAGIRSSDLPMLAAEAAEQWTGRHNPRPFDLKGALEVYQWAY